MNPLHDHIGDDFPEPHMEFALRAGGITESRLLLWACLAAAVAVVALVVA